MELYSLVREGSRFASLRLREAIAELRRSEVKGARSRASFNYGEGVIFRGNSRSK